ncbi:MAG: hypothetical protein KJZ87_26980 [Thermoguttaceae bacterium]|nr:hypothetical protein [Thermoguttaceae bacterium]
MLVDVDRESQAEFRTGSGTVGTEPMRLSVVGWPVKKYVMLRANGANTGVITIGHSAGAAADGFILSAGQQSPPIYVDNLNKVYIVGGAADQGYSWIAC